MNLELLEPAGRELDEAIDYYNRQRQGLGDEFLLEVLAAFDRSVISPKRGRRFPSEHVAAEQGDFLTVSRIIQVIIVAPSWRFLISTAIQDAGRTYSECVQ
jgi:hypothetical protein